MVNICQFYCPGGVVRRMRYVTEQGCRPKSLRGVTEGGGWVKMVIFSVTYLLNHPLGPGGGTPYIGHTGMCGLYGWVFFNEKSVGVGIIHNL